MPNGTADRHRSGVVDALDEAAARLHMAVTFFEGACLDRPTHVAFYRALLDRYADEFAAAAEEASRVVA